MATEVGIKELLEAGVHFGHQTRRWNPKMRRFIHGERGGIHIIDLQKTERLLHRAQEFAGELAGRGGTILFVGTKKQARDTIREAAESCGMPYVNQRWLGGLLTNFQTISKRIKRLHELREWTESGSMDLLPVRERIAAMAERDKLETNLGGVADMQRPPDAMLVIDLKTETIGVREATRLKIPIIGLVDTNCDPDGIDYVIPGNDDAMRSCEVVTRALGDVIASGRGALPGLVGSRRLTRDLRAGPLGLGLGLARGLLLRLAAGLLLGLAALALLLLAAALLLGLAPRTLLLGADPARVLAHDLADRLDHQPARADRVVIARDRVGHRRGIGVGVADGDDRDSQPLGLAHGDRLGLEVDDEDGVGHALHVADAAEVGL